MIITELTIDGDFNRAELERFLKLTKGHEIYPSYNDNLELTGIWARDDG